MVNYDLLKAGVITTSDCEELTSDCRELSDLYEADLLSRVQEPSTPQEIELRYLRSAVERLEQRDMALKWDGLWVRLWWLLTGRIK